METVSTQTRSPISMFLTLSTSTTERSMFPHPLRMLAKVLILSGSRVLMTTPSTPFSSVCMYSLACSMSSAHARTLVPESLNLAIRFSRGMTVQSEESRMTALTFPAMSMARSWSSGHLSSTSSTPPETFPLSL